MRSGQVLLAMFAAVLCAQALGGEPSRPATTIRVYKVADLVAYDAVSRSTLYGKCTMAEWLSEHKETLDALEHLGNAVKTVVLGEHASLAVHPETLSLIVRHSAEGHEEIAGLLEQLRQDNEPRIELTFLGVVPDMFPDAATLPPAGNAESTYSQSPPPVPADPYQAYPATAPKQSRPDDGVPEPTRQRVRELYQKLVLTPEECEELRAICEEHAIYALQEHRVCLANGRKTAWESQPLPVMVTALVSRDRGHVRLRMDNVTDDMHDEFPFFAQSFTIPDGHAKWVLMYCDGGTGRWLVTPKVIAPAADSPVGQRCHFQDDVSPRKH